jgi:hypothetical protein
MTNVEEYRALLDRKCRRLKKAMLILLAVTVVLSALFGFMAWRDSWVWLCAGLLPTIAVWIVTTIVLSIIRAVLQKRKRNLGVSKDKVKVKTLQDNSRVLFISLSVIMSLVTICMFVHNLLVKVRFRNVGPTTNASLLSGLIGIACIVAYVYFFIVFIKFTRIASITEKTKKKCKIAAIIFLSGLILLLITGAMNLTFAIRWVYEVDTFYLTKRISMIVTLCIICIGSYFLDETMKELDKSGNLEIKKNIKYLLTFSTAALPIVLIVETIVRPILYQTYLPLCPEENVYACLYNQFVLIKSIWFSWIITIFLILIICTLLYSLYLITQDYIALTKKHPDLEFKKIPSIVKTEIPYTKKVAVPSVLDRTSFGEKTIDFFRNFDNNPKIVSVSLYTILFLGLCIGISIVVDPLYRSLIVWTGSFIGIVMITPIALFHIHYTRYSSRFKLLTSFDYNTKDFGSKYFVYTSFGIFFIYLGFLVNILLTPRITSVFVISKVFLLICMGLITYGSFNLQKIEEYYRSKDLLKGNNHFFKLLPISTIIIGILLAVDTILKEVLYYYYGVNRCTNYYQVRNQCDNYYRLKTAWMGYIDFFVFGFAAAATIFILYKVMKQLLPVMKQLAIENKIQLTPPKPEITFKPVVQKTEKVVKPIPQRPAEKADQDDLIYCDNCGEKILKTYKFCDSCGMTIESKE